MMPEASERVYEGEYLAVSLERWDGRRCEIVERPDVAAIVACDRDGYVTLVRRLRPPARRRLLELPAGRVESEEVPLVSARRELAKETGLRGGDWRPARMFWTTPGFSQERVYLFFAENLERGEAATGNGEELEIVRVPAARLRESLAEVEDGKTLVGLLLYLASNR